MAHNRAKAPHEEKITTDANVKQAGNTLGLHSDFLKKFRLRSVE
jgi:hypothetical protein